MSDGERAGKSGALSTTKSPAAVAGRLDAVRDGTPKRELNATPEERKRGNVKKKRARGHRDQHKSDKSGHGKASGDKFPRHALDTALKLPKAIIDQNAGRECSEADAAGYVGRQKVSGSFRMEVASAIKYGLLARPKPGRLAVTELAKRILRPQTPLDMAKGLREAALTAPVIGAVYNHYRGENLPEAQFFDNALVDSFGVPRENVPMFKAVFVQSLEHAKLLEQRDGKNRILDFTKDADSAPQSGDTLRKEGRAAGVQAGDSCFVMMPFASPTGAYYELIYEPAIRKAGLTPVRADDSIFGAGKIMDQVWNGIRKAKVLVAELTAKNPNVFYELGLAHALKKPVVLVSSNEGDVPFDLKHIRVIYYDVSDPFWGDKLIAKVAENVVSAIRNPEEAIFRGGE